MSVDTITSASFGNIQNLSSTPVTHKADVENFNTAMTESSTNPANVEYNQSNIGEKPATYGYVCTENVVWDDINFGFYDHELPQSNPLEDCEVFEQKEPDVPPNTRMGYFGDNPGFSPINSAAFSTMGNGYAGDLCGPGEENGYQNDFAGLDDPGVGIGDNDFGVGDEDTSGDDML